MKVRHLPDKIRFYEQKVFGQTGFHPPYLRIPGLILFFFLLSGTVTSVVSHELNFVKENIQLSEALTKLSHKYEVFFSYDETMVADVEVSYEPEQYRDIEHALNQLLAGTSLRYKIFDNRYIILYEQSQQAISSLKGMVRHLESVIDDQEEISQSRKNNRPVQFLNKKIHMQLQPLAYTVSGTVTDQDGETLIGVNIQVKGSDKGTATDIDGRFMLEDIDENAVLVISYIGYETQEVAVAGKPILNIIMTSDSQLLDEVVVVGYGSQKKVNLTGAVSTVDFTGPLESRPITNASQALSGKVSGVWVSQNSGKPGSDGAQIRIRGWGTLNNSNPLVLIDGVEGSFNQVNPNDIESISVLKDAASSAIYGSKAANGVVLVTTKMGSQGEELRINHSSYYGIQALGRHFDMVNNSSEYMELWNQALQNDGASPLFSESLINSFRNPSDVFKYPSTDWFDVLFRNAGMHEHNLSIRGGTDKTTSYLSFNYLDQEGMVPNTSSNRYGIRANIETNVSDKITIGGRFNYIRKVSKEPYADITYGSLGRVFTMLGGAAPFIAPYTRDGQFGSVQAIDEDGTLLYDNRNPLIDAANGRTLNEGNSLAINAYAIVLFSETLSWNTTVASSGNWNMTDRYNESIFGYTDSGIETITKNFNREGIEINRAQTSNLVNNLFSTINYTKSISNAHNISSIIGMQLEDVKIKNLYARRSEPPKEGLTQVDAGTTGIQGEGNLNSLRIYSFFGRINYSYNDKYLFEANLRADGSSRFDKDNRWGIFPGFSTGWRISEENFFNDDSWISDLKLRASWGQLGNQNISGYWPYLTIISQNNNLSYNYGGNFAPGAAVTSLVDKEITWEVTSSLDLGINIGFLDNRLSIEADYFNKVTKDILVRLPIPNILGGISPPFENVGEMSNNGIEVVVNYTNAATMSDNLNYNIGLNITYINNRVNKFRDGDSPDQLYLIREGYPYRSLYGYKSIGIYQSDDEAANHMHSNSYIPKAGNLKFEDVNNDGKLGFEDKQVLGNTIPRYTFGLSSGFKYKGFDLSVLFQGIADINAYTQSLFTDVTDDNPTISSKWRDAWSPDNIDTNIPSIRFNNSWDKSQSSFWIHDISFVKLRNIQLGYYFTNHLQSLLFFQDLYIYVNAQNVFTIVNPDYEGYDPERNTFNSGNNMYPIPRIISLGIKLSF